MNPFMNTGHDLLELYAFVARDNSGEGLPAIQMGSLMMPLVAGDLERVESLREAAQLVADASGQTIMLCRFHHREVLEHITPRTQVGKP
jgi:hypothetical protein